MLGREGFNVYSTDDADEAIDLGKMYDYDILLLGDLDAIRVLQALRTAKCKTPVLVLSGHTDSDSIVRALSVGADDYMTLPVDAPELVARIHTIVRRAKGHAQSLIQVGSLTINLNSKTVSAAGTHIHLTGKEYQMLELLGLRVGNLVTKEMFLNHLYGGMDEPEIKIIDVFICKIRKKLPPDTVQTVWGRGYMLAGAAGAGSATPEVRDFTDDPPSGFVSEKTWNECRAQGLDNHVSRSQREERRALQREDAGRIKSPSLVPESGQK